MALNKTKIEWVRNPDGTPGYTWNPITGCLNHDNGLCRGGGFPCYAFKLANGRLRSRYLANKELAPHNGAINWRDAQDPFYPRFWRDRLGDIPHDWETLAGWQEVKSRGIFVCDMGELFGDWIPRIWQDIIFEEMRKADQHRFYLLTKQPQNLIKFSPFPDNCWVGVTATDRVMYLKATGAGGLDGIEAKVKYISFEPLLEAIHPSEYRLKGIDWVIIGAQTNPYKPPKIEWVEEIVKAADKAGVPVFLKDNLKPLFHKHITIDDKWALNPEKDWQAKGMWRQEMPGR